MLTDSSAEMQTEDQERSDRAPTDPAARCVKDAEPSQPAGEESLARGGRSDEKGVGTGVIPSESNSRPPVTMQNLLQQVRSQIRSQAGLTGVKTGLLDLVQQVRDREAGAAPLIRLPEGDGGGGAGEEAGGVGGTLTNEERGKTEPDATEPLLPASFEEDLEATRTTLRGEFDQQISQLRVEMQAYADRAVKDMESRIKNGSVPHGQAKGRSRDQTEGKAAVDKKQKPLAAAAATAAATAALTSRRSRVLTRTMTTIIPKTCAPVIVGPRAKSETLSGRRDSGSLLMKESDFRVFHAQGRGSSRRALPPVNHHYMIYH